MTKNVAQDFVPDHNINSFDDFCIWFQYRVKKFISLVNIYDECIGGCLILDFIRNNSALIGAIMDKNEINPVSKDSIYWCREIIRQVFDTFKVNRVYGYISTLPEYRYRLIYAKRLGFHVDGVIREFRKIGDKGWIDYYYVSMLHYEAFRRP